MSKSRTAPLLESLDATIRAALPDPGAYPGLSDFYHLIRDYPERGGKRMRGLLVLLSTAAHGADWQRGLRIASALELFQNWVLIHDDIEDGSDERRGRPTLHKLAGMPIALNVGDALHVLMWQQVHAMTELPAERTRDVIHELEETIRRTAEGQHLDLRWVESGRFDIDEADYLRMVALKTARYTVVSPLRLGALCADREPDPRLDAAGEALGVAFQIRDDVLNLMEGASTGKEFAGDLYEGKRTLILAHLLAHAPPAEKEAIGEVLSAPRSRKTPQDIEFLLASVRRHGSAAYAQEVAEQKARHGLGCLAEMLDALPGRPWAKELTQLLQSLASRAH